MKDSATGIVNKTEPSIERLQPHKFIFWLFKVILKIGDSAPLIVAQNEFKTPVSPTDDINVTEQSVTRSCYASTEIFSARQKPHTSAFMCLCSAFAIIASCQLSLGICTSHHGL